MLQDDKTRALAEVQYGNREIQHVCKRNHKLVTSL